MIQLVAAAPGDDQLVAAAGRGDERAFDLLVGPHVDVAYRLAASMLGERAAAEDAVQDATLKAWRALPRLRPDSNVRAWFLTIVANTCRSQLRSRWWSVIRTPDFERTGASAEDSAAQLDLRRALTRLDPVDRAVVLLRYYEDLPLEEVAAVAGLSVAAARSRVYRALAKLRLQLEESR